MCLANSLSSLSAESIPLIVIIGPTAVGKTDLSIRIAYELGAEIVSADSRLFYCGMDIGTAKPTQEERNKVPHYLIDVAKPDETWSLAMFQQAAHNAIINIYARGKLPFLVGGTGQYIRAVIQGWDLPAQAPNPRLRSLLEEWGKRIGHIALHNHLAVLDSQAAALIDSRNIRPTIRALEVIFLTGRRFSEQRQRQNSPFRLQIIGLTRPRPELYDRIDRRIQAMLTAGFVHEVHSLLSQGYMPSLPSMSAIGYKQIADYLTGRSTLEEAVTLIKRQTRVFVRRQSAWFRTDDPDIRWFNAGDNVDQEIINIITTFTHP